MTSSNRFFTPLAFHASAGRKQVILCISLFRPGSLKSSSTGIARNVGRLTRVSGMVAESAMVLASGMLSSACGSTAQHASLHVTGAAISHLCERVCSEALPLPKVSFPGSGMRVGRLRVKVVKAEHVSHRRHAFRTDASVFPLCSTSPSANPLVITRAWSGQALAEPSPALEEDHLADEFLAREAVLKYLESEEIDTAELEDVALPPSVEIMKERLTFLRKIGLSTKDINGYPLMVGCSVKKNLVPVLSYLEKLNVEARFLPDLIRKYPLVLNSSVVMDLEPVISFLQGIGIERTNLGRVLTRFPDVLGFKIEGTMSTSVAYLVSLGVNMRDIGHMITEYPEILGMRVGNNIKPKVDYILALGVPKEILAKILEVKPFILGFDLEDRMKPAIQDLRDVGVRDEFISRVLIQYADVLGLDIKHRLESKIGWLSKYAGVKHQDIGRVIEKLPQILAINIVLAQSRVTFLRDQGFSVEDLGIMVTKCPQILALSVDGALKPNLDFFVKTMKRPLTELVNYPFYFTYSLDKRIQPRYKQLQEKGIHCSLSWFLNCSDAKFAGNLILEFVDRPDEDEEEPTVSMDEDEEEPTVSMGGRMRIKGENVGNEAADEGSNVVA